MVFGESVPVYGSQSHKNRGGFNSGSGECIYIVYGFQVSSVLWHDQSVGVLNWDGAR